MLLIAVVCTIALCDRLKTNSSAWRVFRVLPRDMIGSPFVLNSRKCSSKRTSLDPAHPPHPEKKNIAVMRRLRPTRSKELVTRFGF